MKKITYVILFALLGCLSCGDDDSSTAVTTNNAGLTVKDRSTSFEETYSSVKQQVTAKGYNIIAEVDHSAAAEGVGLTLNPTRVIIFGNPMGGTVLMQQDQRMGIELPLKMLIRADEDGEIKASYYNADELLGRYGVSVAEDLKNTINSNLDLISAGELSETAKLSGNIANDMVVKESMMSAAMTYDSLEAVLIANEFNVIAKVEHDQAAAGVGLELRPTKVIIFGKPQVGSQLMQSNNQIGIDLPQKILVWEDEAGKVWLGYYNATFLASRHGITDKAEVVTMINTALDNLTNAVVN